MYIANPEKSSPFLLHTWKNAPNGPREKPFAAPRVAFPYGPADRARSDQSRCHRRPHRTAKRTRRPGFSLKPAGWNGGNEKPKKRDRVCFFCCCALYYISSLFLRKPERWLSGRRRRSRKPLTGYSRSGVRIPLSPPFSYSDSEILSRFPFFRPNLQGRNVFAVRSNRADADASGVITPY